MTLPPRRRDGAIALALTVLTLAVFWRVGTFDFICLDDPLYVTENPHIAHGLTWEGIKWAFRADLTEQSPNADYWQPVVFLSRMLDIQLFGLNPAGHHLMNLFFHTLNVLILFALLRRATGAVWPCAFVAAVFAVHPLQVEAVAWVTARKDVLSVCFGLLALHAYLGYARRPAVGRYLAVAGPFALALLSKPMMVTLPGVMLLLDYWPLRRELRARLAIEKLPLLAMAAGSAIVTSAMGQPDAYGGAGPGFITGYVLSSYGWYIAKLFHPGALAPHCLIPGNEFQPWQAVISGALLVAVTFLAVRERRRRPHLIVGWLWLLGTLAPVVGLPARMERHTYLAMVGLLIGASWSAAEWRSRPRILAAAATVVVVACAIRTWTHLPNWKDSFTLFRHAIEAEPDNWEAHQSLGCALAGRKRFDDAIVHFRESLKINPDNDRAMGEIGSALENTGRMDEAVDRYESALRMNPRNTRARTRLAVALANRGDLEAARNHLAEVARLQPGDPAAHRNLAQALAGLGRTGEAGAHYREALRLQPDYADALNNLAWILATHPDPKFRDGPEAVRLAEKLESRDAEALDTLAAAYAEAGRFADAARTVQKALDLAPPEPLAADIRGRLELYRQGKPYREGMK